MKNIVIILLLIISSFSGFSQNYYQEFPINTTVNINGSQYQLVCTTYDSTLQTTVTYNSPWINKIIVPVGISPGKVFFTTWVTPLQQNSDYGFIVYDYLLHQFAVHWIQGNIGSNQRVFLGSGIKWFAELVETELPSGNYHFKYKYYRYNLQNHTWASVTFPYPEYETNPFMGGYVSTPGNNEWIYFIEDTDEGIFHFYKSGTGTVSTITSGCAGWGYNIMHDYISMDTGCLDDYFFGAFDAELGYFTGYPRGRLLGGHFHGVFTASDQDSSNRKFFFVYDEAIHQWLTDSVISDNITSITVKNRVIAYIDETVGFSKKVFYMVHDPLLNMWVKDSTTIAGGAGGLTIQNGTVKWTDANGLNVRGYDVNQGWGNYNTPLFLYFHLIDFSSQGHSMVHVRNYSIGTDNVYFDMGDGTISQGNQHVMWRHYRDSGSYNICIYDSSGQQSWCQSVFMNNCSSAGSLIASNDTLCMGDTIALSMTTFSGSVQWQKFENSVWVDDTTSGSTSAIFNVSPIQTTRYRAKVVNGNCIPAYSNEQFIHVYESSANLNLSDTSLSICAGSEVTLKATNIPGLTYSWQWNTGGGWVNPTNGNTFSYTVNPVVPTQYRLIYSNTVCFSDTSAIIEIHADSLPPNPQTTAAYTCGPGTVNLTANGPGAMHWYLITSLDSSIYIGNTYSTFISANTQFQVRSYDGTFFPVGYNDNSIGGVTINANQSNGIRISSSVPVSLESFYVYPTQTGMLRLLLKKVSTNETIATLDKPVIGGSGPVKVFWSIGLQSNTLYDIVTATSSVPLEVNTGGFSYPFSSPGNPVTIVGYVNATFDTTNDHYNFYEMTFADGCRSNFASAQGIVSTPFVASISANGPLAFCQGDSVKLNTSPTGSFSYQWLKNGSPVGSTGNSYTAKTAGTYVVVMSSSSGCIDTSSAMSVRVPCMPTFEPVERMETEEFVPANAINIFYDPFSKNGIISSSLLESGKYKMVIVDLSGKVIYRNEFEFSQGENSTHINLEQLSSGVYIFKLFSDKESFIKKVVKY